MKQLNYLISTFFLSLLFISPILANTHLETVWAKEYNALANEWNKIVFSSDLANGKDNLFIMNASFFGNGSCDSTRLDLFQINKHTGKPVMNYIFSVTHPKYFKPKVLKKYGDTVVLFNYYDKYDILNAHLTFNLRYIRTKFSDTDFGSGGFISKPSYYKGVVDTSVKGTFNFYDSKTKKWSYIGDEFHYNKNCGLISRRIDTKTNRGKYDFKRLGSKDSLTVNRLNEGSLLGELTIGNEEQLVNTQTFDLDSNKILSISQIVTLDKSGTILLKTNGLLFVHFDAEGNVLSRKIIKEDESKVKYTYFNRAIYGAGSIFILGRYGFTSYFLREITLDGKVVKEVPINYIHTPILEKYYKEDVDFNHRMQITENKELYIWGGNMIFNSDVRYANYISKYDNNGNLIYEKEWRPTNSTNAGLESDNLILEGNYVYVVGSDLENDKLWIYKFKEVQSSIADFGNSIHINLYPNPCDSKSHLSLDLLNPCDLDISLCDVLGRTLSEIHTGYISSGMFSRDIDLQGLSSGVYYLKIQIDGVSQLKKLIVK